MRKKITYFLLASVLLVVILPPVNNSSELTIGDILEFKILKSRIFLQVNDEKISVKGYEFNGEKYLEDSKIKFNFINIDDRGSYRTNTSIGDSYREDLQLSGWFSWRLDDTFMFPAVLSAYRFGYWWHVNNFNSTPFNRTYSLGFSSTVYPYLYPSQNYWTLIGAIEDYYCPIFDIYNQQGYEIDYAFIHSDENDLVYFESWNGGKIIDGDLYLATGEFKDMKATMNFGSQFQIAIQKSTGIVKGLHFRGWANGVVDEYNIKISKDFHYECIDYNLPNFSYGVYSNYVSSFESIIAFPTIIMFAMITIIKRKRRKKIITNYL